MYVFGVCDSLRNSLFNCLLKPITGPSETFEKCMLIGKTSRKLANVLWFGPLRVKSISMVWNQFNIELIHRHINTSTTKECKLISFQPKIFQIFPFSVLEKSLAFRLECILFVEEFTKNAAPNVNNRWTLYITFYRFRIIKRKMLPTHLSVTFSACFFFLCLPFSPPLLKRWLVNRTHAWWTGP